MGFFRAFVIIGAIMGVAAYVQYSKGEPPRPSPMKDAELAQLVVTEKDPAVERGEGANWCAIACLNRCGRDFTPVIALYRSHSVSASVGQLISRGRREVPAALVQRAGRVIGQPSSWPPGTSAPGPHRERRAGKSPEFRGERDR